MTNAMNNNNSLPVGASEAGMPETWAIPQLQEKILTVRGKEVLLAKDVAALYGVETRVLNQQMKRNADKFSINGEISDKYVFRTTEEETETLRSQIVTSKKDGESRGGNRYNHTCFTEKGLYMVATILNSDKAIKVTQLIIDTFAEVRRIAMEAKNAKIELFRKEGKRLEEKVEEQSKVIENKRAAIKLKNMENAQLTEKVEDLKETLALHDSPAYLGWRELVPFIYAETGYKLQSHDKTKIQNYQLRNKIGKWKYYKDSENDPKYCFEISHVIAYAKGKMPPPEELLNEMEEDIKKKMWEF